MQPPDLLKNKEGMQSQKKKKAIQNSGGQSHVVI